MGGPTTSPNKSKMAEGGRIEFRKNVISLYYIYTHISYEDATTTDNNCKTAVSLYNVVDSVATNTTPRFREINTQITRSRRRCISFVKSLQERYVIVHRSLIMLLWVCRNSERVTPNGAFYTKIHDCRPISRSISETIYEG